METSRDQAKKAIEKLVDQFAEQYASYHKSTYDEATLRIDFINKFFKALGWDVDNVDGLAEDYREVIYEDKLKIGKSTKAPDYGFRLSGSEKRLFFVEAKKPSVPIKTDKSAAYQLRRYGRSAQTSVSILTNFEELAIYDCSKTPSENDSAAVNRIKYLQYGDYITEFDFIYDTFSREAVVKGRFDKFVQSDTNKRGSVPLDKEFVEVLNNWRKDMAVSIAKNNVQLSEEQLNFAVQQTIDRLIFLRFCEDRAVEHYGNLKNTTAKGDTYQNLLSVFNDADKKYNSGLFDFEKDTITENLKIDNKVIKNIVLELYYPKCEYEFSVLPVEILGNAYQQFLGKVIRITAGHSAKIDDKPEVRKAGGVYYTPQYIVDYIVAHTVGELVKGKSPEEIEKIKIVDPACGSGSFLLGAFKYLIKHYTDWYIANGYMGKKNGGSKLTPGGRLVTAEKRKILLTHIYGVDLDSNAVEVSKLSLLLKSMEGETEASINQQLTLHHERILPDLDKNIVCGNSLIGHDFFESELGLGGDVITELQNKMKPFDWQLAFPKVFKQGGFDVVVGNPPYVQSREGNVLDYEKDYFYKKYKTAEYQINTFGLFIERGINILKPDGLIGLIIPNYWLSTKYDRKLRKFIFQENKADKIINVYNVFEAAVVDTLLLIGQKGKQSKSPKTTVRSIDRNIKTIAERLAKINEGTWAYETELTLDPNSDDIAISFREGLNLEAKKSLQDYFLLKFGAKLYEIGKGIPPQTKTFSDKAIYESKSRIDNSYLKLLRARSIKRYYLDWQNDWINNGDNLAAPRSVEIFRGDRILVQRIVSKDLLDATFIDTEYICNTDVITLKPLDTKIDCKFFLAILNSKLCGKFIKSNNVNLDRAAFPKINTNTLELFPVPDYAKVNKPLRDKVIQQVEILLDLKQQLQTTQTPTAKQQLENRIAYTNKKIDELVYELYGLNEEEIGIIEGTTETK